MNILLIGSNGRVGQLMVKTLEDKHNCTHLDLYPVENVTGRCIIGSVSDRKLMEEILQGFDSVIWLALGGGHTRYNDSHSAFDVNTRDWYWILDRGIKAGIKHFIYISTMSVYHDFLNREFIDEDTPSDSTDFYGISKLLAELASQNVCSRFKDIVVLVYRLVAPYGVDEISPFAKNESPKIRQMGSICLRADELEDLYLRGLNFDQPGCHILNTMGNYDQNRFPTKKAEKLLGWTPKQKANFQATDSNNHTTRKSE
ncbi:NAD-dependent epimerase/dehydratase family protein [Pseudomonadota bacterium]